MSNDPVQDALERFRNSGGFACSDPTDDVIADLMTLAQAYDRAEPIQAALLAACQAVVAHLSTTFPPYNDGEGPTQKCLAAIAKAKGEPANV